MIASLQLLRNVGQFDSVSAGARLPFEKWTLMYAGNGRGKTTLAAIFRSLATGNPIPIVERQRLAASNAPHVVLTPSDSTTPVVFHNGSWTRCLPEIAVFDDIFVAENICSGVDVDPEQRQNLHDLILGARGVALSKLLQDKVTRIEQHNRALRARADAIPSAARGSYSVEDFCTFHPRADIDTAIQETERSLAASQAEEPIRDERPFDLLYLPAFDTQAISDLLGHVLPELDAAAVTRVQSHVERLGRGGEAWIDDGVRRIAAVRTGEGEQVCPFCTQPITGVQVISTYRSYFSAAYRDLKQSVATLLASVQTAHTGEVTAAFERSIRVAAQHRQFWASFVEVPDFYLDTAAIARAWKAAAEHIIASLQTKQGAPLERLQLSPEAVGAIATYEQLRSDVAALSARLQQVNSQIAIVKERAATGNVANLIATLGRLKTLRQRFTPEIDALCIEYLAEKLDKAETETQRDQARAQLDEYRQNVFPAYEAAINTYLQRFNAGFSLRRIGSVNNRGGSACTYHMLINTVEVAISAVGDAVGPSFKNTLSSGDRNTLALAFFFASLDQDPQLRQKVVVIDDPMTSLDEHRSLTTIQEMRRLEASVAQMIVLSHSKPFLCALWEGADKATRTALRIARDGAGSTLASWDVNSDSITEHDRRHILVREYMRTNNAANERQVAQDLRPILESFVRVAYPEHFPPESLLGPFHYQCQQKLGQPDQIMSPPATAELRALLDYANRFHHDTNPAWETATINDSELNHFCNRTLNFTRLP